MRSSRKYVEQVVHNFQELKQTMLSSMMTRAYIQEYMPRVGLPMLTPFNLLLALDRHLVERLLEVKKNLKELVVVDRNRSQMW